MRVLLTRPLEDSRATAARLAALGHTCLISPLLTIHERAGPALDLADVQGLVVTSINGARALAHRTTRRDLPVYAVGTQTAAELQQNGFAAVKDADGDAIALANAIAGWTVPGSGPLLHLGGADVSGKLRTRLAELGFDLRREILYDAHAAHSLTGEAQTALRNGALDVVLLYSPRSAEAFVRCATKAGLVEACRKIIAAVISPAAADKANALPFAAVRSAAHPSEKYLLDLLRR